MLKVTVELLPHGDESRASVIGVMLITNDGSGSLESGNYVATLMAEYLDEPRKGRLTGFQRKRQSCWSLVGGFLKLFGHTGHSPPGGLLGRRASRRRWGERETNKESETGREMTPYNQFQESIRSHVRNGWKIYYDPATMFVGADNPKGGRMSICEVKVCDRSGLDPHVFGQMIADRLNEIGRRPE